MPLSPAESEKRTQLEIDSLKRAISEGNMTAANMMFWTEALSFFCDTDIVSLFLSKRHQLQEQGHSVVLRLVDQNGDDLSGKFQRDADDWRTMPHLSTTTPLSYGYIHRDFIRGLALCLVWGEPGIDQSKQPYGEIRIQYNKQGSVAIFFKHPDQRKLIHQASLPNNIAQEDILTKINDAFDRVY